MSSLTPKKVNRELKEVATYALFLQGKSINAIAYELKLAPATVKSYIRTKQSELKDQYNIDLVDARNIALARLDATLVLLTEELNNAEDDFDLADGKIYRDGIKAKCMLVDRIQRTMDMQCKLLGLYAPEKIEQSVKSTNEVTVDIDYENMELGDLEKLFANQMRNK